MHVYVSASEILKLARTWSTGMFCGSSIRGRSVCSLRGFTCVVYGTVCVGEVGGYDRTPTERWHVPAPTAVPRSTYNQYLAPSQFSA